MINNIEYTPRQLAAAAENVAGAEAAVRDKIAAAADKVISGGYKLILVAGPSCSCKTGFTVQLDKALEATGLGSSEISMDDYYKNRDECPILADGTRDIESPDSVDIALLNEQLAELAEDRPVDLPLFDFPTARRKKETKRMTPLKNGVIIVEGINALNPVVASNIDSGRVLRIYVCPGAEVRENGKTLLTSRDIRFVRRMVRDVHSRGNGVEKTMRMWPGVCKGEAEFITPFIDQADLCIDTFHPYELSLFKNHALSCLPVDAGDYAGMFSNLRYVMGRLPAVPSDALPPDSLMREFIE